MSYMKEDVGIGLHGHLGIYFGTAYRDESDSAVDFL